MIDLDLDNINPELGATFIVQHLASGVTMGLGPMSPGLADRVATAWRGRKVIQPSPTQER